LDNCLHFLGLPPNVVRYSGVALWALTLYWMVSALLARVPLFLVGIVTGILATGVERLKLSAGGPGLDGPSKRARGCPRSLAVKCTDILYILSLDILYTCCHPVKRRRALLESNLAEE